MTDSALALARMLIQYAQLVEAWEWRMLSMTGNLGEAGRRDLGASPKPCWQHSFALGVGQIYGGMEMFELDSSLKGQNLYFYC